MTFPISITTPQDSSIAGDDTLRHGFQAALKRAGLPAGVHQHDLRHARVTRWLAAGKPIHLVPQAMGHSTVRVTEGYLHLVPQDLRQLVEDPEQEVFRELVGA